MSDEARTSIRVLVADASAFFRQSLKLLLAQEPRLQVVAVAGDAGSVTSRLEALHPDVLVLDERLLESGGDALRRAMGRAPGLGVLVLVRAGGDLARHPALANVGLRGATGCIARPLEDLEQRMDALAAEIGERVVALAERRRTRVAATESVAPPCRAPRGRAPRVIAIGASTGGTVALRTILESLPTGIPGIVIVQHMPERFTGSFAENLDRAAAIDVHLAQDGDIVRSGCALLAPGNRHLELVSHENGYAVRVVDSPPVNRHRPSVDVLFDSVAGCAGADALGVLLTGMGADGARGLLAMRNAGAHTLAQDEASSVVFGMPREAIERGAAERVVALSQMAGEIAQQACLSRIRVAPRPAVAAETKEGTDRWRRS